MSYKRSKRQRCDADERRHKAAVGQERDGCRRVQVGEGRRGKMNSTFDIRRPTTVVRHSTTDSRLSNVGRRSAVGRRMSNVVLWEDPATLQETADTPQESTGTTQEKTGTTQESAVKSAVKNLVADERVAEKCITLWSFLKEDPQRTITNAVERLSWSRRSIVTYIGILKQAKALEHIGPYHGGVWKFLI